MSQEVLTTETNRRQLQQIIAGLSDGVILLERDQSILWANEAALAMHGVGRIGDLGHNSTEYAQRFNSALSQQSHAGSGELSDQPRGPLRNVQ
jgi:PAS domain-containing protein